MPRHFLLAVLVALGLMSGAQAGVIPDRLAKAVQDRVDAGTYPVMVIGMIDGDKTEVRAFGLLPDGKAPDGDTVFEIGSLTKTFTATLLADAVTRGEVSLDDPVAKLLPDFTIPSRGSKQITLGDIADQHSGLPRMPDNFHPADPGNPYADYDAAKMKAFLATYALPRNPGAAYEYSNLGFGLLGQALAASAHSDYATLLRRRILEPLKMNSTGIAFTAAMCAHLAPGHDETGKPAEQWDLGAFAGAGAIRSTVNDLMRYLRANMGVDKTKLSAAMQLAHLPRADMSPGQRVGLAWMTFTSAVGPITWHSGATGGYASNLGFTADGRRGIVILTNAAVNLEDIGLAAFDPNAPLTPAHKAIPATAAQLAPYAGTYKVAEGLLLHIFPVGDQLYGQATGQVGFALYNFAPDEFFSRVGGISVSFTRDAKGVVTGLVLHQNGDRIAPRLPDAPAVTLDAATLASYVGKYPLAPNAVFDVMLKDGQLLVQMTGQPRVAIFASARDKFFYRVAEAQIDFERDAAGAVVALTLHQNGRDMRAPRLKE